MCSCYLQLSSLNIYSIKRYANGNSFEGTFAKDKRQGSGLLRFADGRVNELNDNERPSTYIKVRSTKMIQSPTIDEFGNSIVKYDNGDLYRGEMKDNMRHGTGTMRYANGDVYVLILYYSFIFLFLLLLTYYCTFRFILIHSYEGKFHQNSRQGKGVLTYNSGHVYNGEWNNDLREGRCIYKYFYGDIYEGSYFNDHKSGTGTYVSITKYFLFHNSFYLQFSQNGFSNY